MKLSHAFFAMTGVFWLAIAYYAAVQTPRPSAAAAAADGPQAPRVTRRPGLPTLTAAELGRHASAGDCWIAIAGTVYDLSAYVDIHPSKHQEMDAYCGKDGTRPWDAKSAGKDKGKPHTRRSAEFLEEYPQMGVLKE